jgi:uncharacterized Zn-binding protein involved in type VI secretion
MPGVSRKYKDIAGGVIVQGSPTVFVNGKPAVRIYDLVSCHGLSPHSSPIIIQGSNSVFVNGKRVCRAGDRANCGHPATGSKNVFAGK